MDEAGEDGRTAAGGEAPEISVIVPHYNDTARLGLCLERLIAQSVPAPDYEIIVVDNGTPGGLGPLVARFPQVRFLVEPQKGAAHARNAGVAAARAPRLAFIDCDCIPEPDWLAAGLAGLAQADLVGGSVTVTCSDPVRPSPVERFERIFAFDQARYVQEKHFSVTANLLTHRVVFDAVGPFRDGYPEDVDWCHRARAKGYRLAYVEAARVSHPARRSWAELESKWRRTSREAFRAARDQPGWRWRWPARALLVLVSPFAHAGRVLGSSEAGGPLARIATLLVLFRLRLFRVRFMLALMGKRP
ncbi:MAG: glycosyltransferase [Alphaproteobacteria bacterium]|nr:glycosyltransferase [Alphaproteobacteria bacterium]